MRYFYILSVIGCAVIFLSNENGKNKQHQYDGFAFKSGGFDVMLDLPETPYDYNGIKVPEHYSTLQDFIPIGVPYNIDVDDDAATLGRVIFYDQNMSFNRTVSCGSCHVQTKGFADHLAKSEGFDGVLTNRNTLSFTDFKTSLYPSLFWDDRSNDIREASILPLLNSDEMGMTMSEVIDRMEKTDYYPNLFNEAFGTNEIIDDKIADALAQFLVSISSYETKYDLGFNNNFAYFSDSELNGMEIFQNNCNNCHSDIPLSIDPNNEDMNLFFKMMIFNGPHNIGLDTILKDIGLANTTNRSSDEGRFKTPSLKNVVHTGPYMHDGRFKTLEEVINFYSDELQPHPNSIFVNSPDYQEQGVGDTIVLPITGFKFTDDEKEDLEAFLRTLSDNKMLTNPMFSDPFVKVISSVDEINEVEQFKAYPNPFTSVLNVSFSNPKSALATVKLFDLNGQLVKHNVTTNNNYVLERDNLPSGTYIVEVLLDDKTSNTKIIAE